MFASVVLFLVGINPAVAQCSELNKSGGYEWEEIDLTGVDFQGVDFSNRKFLRKMNFNDTNLTKAKLLGANISRSNKKLWSERDYKIDYDQTTAKTKGINFADWKKRGAIIVKWTPPLEYEKETAINERVGLVNFWGNYMPIKSNPKSRNRHGC